jgi:hypothetical protein
MQKVGRNDPCPCNSGKKYKHGHGQASAIVPSESERAAGLHELDHRIVMQTVKLATRKYGPRFLDELLESLGLELNQTNAPFLLPAAVYGWVTTEGTLIDRFLESPAGRQLSAREQAWIQAQKASWFSIWEITAITRGQGLTAHDLFTGEERNVTERAATDCMALHDGFLGRISDFEGLSLLSCAYPRLLPPRPLSRVVTLIRKVSRLPKKNVTIERLRRAMSFEDWCDAWGGMVDEYYREASKLPELHNTDGDPLLMTRDHFAFDPRHRSNIETELRALSDDRDDDLPKKQVFTFLRPGNAMHKSWETTVIGRALLAERELVLETNSIRRANELWARVEAALGGSLHHRARQHEDPEAMMGKLPQEPIARRSVKREPSPPEVIEALREMKSNHYRDWLDTAIPALSGMTPREAAKKARSRANLILLLKEMENGESRLPEAERFDISTLRSELGLGAST